MLADAFPDAPVFATQATRDRIEAIEAERRAQAGQRLILPDTLLTPGQEWSIGGLTFQVEDLDDNEASNLTVLYLPEQRALFASDLIYADCHAWLSEGQSQGWIDDLDYLRDSYAQAQAVYAGHGAGDTGWPGVERQLTYLRFFQEQIRRRLPASGVLDATAKAEIKTAMAKAYPGYPLDNLLDDNIDAVATELAQA